jgi:transcriptional regulator with XRE-family HTH domain
MRATGSDSQASPPSALQQRRRELLRAAGVTQAEIAARIGVSRQSVGLVLVDHHRSRRVEQAIAEACGAPVEELFPAERVAPRPGHDGVDEAGKVTEPPPDGREATRVAVPDPVAPAEDRTPELAYRIEAELRRIAQDVFLGMVEQGIPPEHRVARAAAAALRELGR